MPAKEEFHGRFPKNFFYFINLSDDIVQEKIDDEIIIKIKDDSEIKYLNFYKDNYFHRQFKLVKKNKIYQVMVPCDANYKSGHNFCTSDKLILGKTIDFDILVKNYINKKNCNIKYLPDEYITDEMKHQIKMNQEMDIKKIPKNLITEEHVLNHFKVKKNLEDVPEMAITQKIIDFICNENNQDAIDLSIPENLRTKENYLKIMNQKFHYPYYFEIFPKEFITIDDAIKHIDIFLHSDKKYIFIDNEEFYKKAVFTASWFHQSDIPRKFQTRELFQIYLTNPEFHVCQKWCKKFLNKDIFRHRIILICENMYECRQCSDITPPNILSFEDLKKHENCRFFFKNQLTQEFYDYYVEKYGVTDEVLSFPRQFVKDEHFMEIVNKRQINLEGDEDEDEIFCLKIMDIFNETEYIGCVPEKYLTTEFIHDLLHTVSNGMYIFFKITHIPKNDETIKGYLEFLNCSEKINKTYDSYFTNNE